MKLFYVYLHDFSLSTANHEEWFVNVGTYVLYYNVSQHYINDASILCIVAACTCVYPRNMALGQVVTNIVGHVDSVWDTKQVYTRTTLK